MSIAVSARLSQVLASRTFRMVCRATITRGRRVLAANLPVDIGREECDATLRIPERVSLQIPRTIDGVDWSDDGLASPVMPWGQRIHVKIGVGVGPDGYEWINRGEFLIHDVEYSGPTVTINAVGLLALLDEARLVAPYKPTGTIVSALRKLVEPALTVRVSSALADRSVAGANIVEEDRLQGVLDICRGWPAQAHVTPGGWLQIDPPGTYGGGGDDPDMIIMRRHIPYAGAAMMPNVVTVTTAASREGVVNAVVARGETPEGAPIQGVAYDRSGGPASYGGPYNPLPVVEYFAAGVVTSVPIARAIANLILSQRAAPLRRSWKVDCVPQPRILLNDQLTYRPDTSTSTIADVVVDRLVMPYTSASGPMQLTLRELA